MKAFLYKFFIPTNSFTLAHVRLETLFTMKFDRIIIRCLLGRTAVALLITVGYLINKVASAADKFL